jgi:hypothetical protein
LLKLIPLLYQLLVLWTGLSVLEGTWAGLSALEGTRNIEQVLRRLSAAYAQPVSFDTGFLPLLLSNGSSAG